MIPMVPFLIDLDRPDQPEDSADSVHEIGTCIKIAPHGSVSLVDPGIAISGLRPGRSSQ